MQVFAPSLACLQQVMVALLAFSSCALALEGPTHNLAAAWHGSSRDLLSEAADHAATPAPSGEGEATPYGAVGVAGICATAMAAGTFIIFVLKIPPKVEAATQNFSAGWSVVSWMSGFQHHQAPFCPRPKCPTQTVCSIQLDPSIKESSLHECSTLSLKQVLECLTATCRVQESLWLPLRASCSPCFTALEVITGGREDRQALTSRASQRRLG